MSSAASTSHDDELIDNNEENYKEDEEEEEGGEGADEAEEQEVPNQQDEENDDDDEEEDDEEEEEQGVEHQRSKTHLVDKPDDLAYDLRNLLATDNQPLLFVPSSSSNSAKSELHIEEELKALARDNTQLLLNKIFALPAKRITSSIFGGSAFVVELPRATTNLPRAKHVPAPKQATKWELYRQAKGIKKRKKTSRMSYDESTDSYRPRYGYNAAATRPTDSWVLEDKPEYRGSDAFTVEEGKKKKRVDKHKKQTEDNLKRGQKKSVDKQKILTSVELPSTSGSVGALKRRVDKGALKEALQTAHRSTASLGKFDAKLRNQKATKPSQKATAPVQYAKSEKDKSLKLLDRMFSKKEPVNMDKAIRQVITKEQNDRRAGKESGENRKRTNKGSKAGPSKKKRK